LKEEQKAYQNQKQQQILLLFSHIPYVTQWTNRISHPHISSTNLNKTPTNKNDASTWLKHKKPYNKLNQFSEIKKLLSKNRRMKRGMRQGKTFDCKSGRDWGVALRGRRRLTMRRSKRQRFEVDDQRREERRRNALCFVKRTANFSKKLLCSFF
jgi:hypothetical protein